MAWQCRCFLVSGLAFTFLCLSQMYSQTPNSGSSSPPLGDVVKKAKQNAGPKAKTVINEETLKPQDPIPAIAFADIDNSDDIIKAIHEFKKNHSPSETEETVRQWYDESDSIFLKALDDNARLIVRKEDRTLADVTGEYNRAGDYSRAVERRNGAIREDRNDFRSYRSNGFRIARIQQTLMKVRNDLQVCGLRYEWFKIRNGNGNGSF